MEGGDKQNHLGREENSQEALPPLIKAIVAKEVAGFDSVKEHRESSGIEAIENDAVSNSKSMTHSVSISMPSSPIEANLHKSNHVFFKDNNDTVLCNAISYSQPIPKNGKLKSFDSFKTWSGKLERQLSNFRGKVHQESKEELRTHPLEEIETLPVERYFDALEGPELDTLKASEETILPKDKPWPFLLRFPISSFGICLGLSSHAIMWKTLASSNSTKFLHVISPYINLVLWFISIFFVTIISFIYSLKVILYFEAIRREFNHPIRVNFFFAPWIAVLFLVLGVPPSISRDLSPSLWYIFMMPIFLLEVKIYGQWMSGGERRLSKVANPSNHLSILGNFVGALLGASMGLKEGPIFFFAIGLAHYVVLFVTLYQRLPTNKTLPKELHPVFFLFVAAPNVASMAWARIQGSFDYGARLPYFIALFLYFSLVVRVNFFRGFRFSLGWWAYTFPMTGAAIATIKYSNAVTNIATKSLALVLCIVATLVLATLLVTTIIHAFVLRDLFPNDIAIAISETKPRLTTRRWYHRRSSSSDIIVEPNLKCSNHDDADIEASLGSKCSNHNQDLSKNDTHQNIYYDKRSDVS